MDDKRYPVEFVGDEFMFCHRLIIPIGTIAKTTVGTFKVIGWCDIFKCYEVEKVSDECIPPSDNHITVT